MEEGGEAKAKQRSRPFREGSTGKTWIRLFMPPHEHGASLLQFSASHLFFDLFGLDGYVGHEVGVGIFADEEIVF